MKNLYLLFFFPFLLVAQTGYAQQKQGLPDDNKRAIPAVSFFLAGDYFSPKFEQLDAVFQTIEKNYSLPAGTNFKDYYSLLAGIRFAPANQQSIQVEFGGSLFKSNAIGLPGQNHSASFIQMYYTGASYLLSFPVGAINLFLGGGAGYIWLDAQRSYTVQPGVARIDAGLTQFHGLGGIEFIDRSGVSLALDGGYSYATTLFPQRGDVDFTIKGVTGEIKIGVPLIKMF